MNDHSEPSHHSPHVTPDLGYALDTLVRVVERQSREFIASILLLSEDGRRVLDAAGPSLPRSYREAIDGLEVGPAAGSCGTAAYRNRRVIVSDIGSDPLWEGYRELARAAGLAACWSQPIRSASGQVLGTFALYYREPRSPSAEELEIIEAAARHAGTILERAAAGAGREDLMADLA